MMQTSDISISSINEKLHIGGLPASKVNDDMVDFQGVDNHSFVCQALWQLLGVNASSEAQRVMRVFGR